MSNFSIPLTADTLNLSVQTSFDGVIYTLKFGFNDRDGYWYLNLLDEQENVITNMPAGEKIVLNYYILVDYLPGFLWATLSGGLTRKPEDLTNMDLRYYDRESTLNIIAGTEGILR